MRKRERDEAMADEDAGGAVAAQEGLQGTAFDCMDYIAETGRDILITAHGCSLHVTLGSFPASTARLYNLQPGSEIRFQLCFGDDCLKDDEAPAVYIKFTQEGQERRACVRSTHLLNACSMHHIKALLISIDNDISILWTATRPPPPGTRPADGSPAGSPTPKAAATIPIAGRAGAAGAAAMAGPAAAARAAAASGVVDAAAAAAAAAGPAAWQAYCMGLIRERVLQRFNVNKESYQDDLFAVDTSVNQLHVNKDTLAQQIIDHTLAVSEPTLRRLKSNLVVRLVQLIAYNVHQLPRRCFMCGSPHAHEMDNPQCCTNSLCRYKLCNGSLCTDVLSAVQQRPDGVPSRAAGAHRSLLTVSAVEQICNAKDALKPAPVDFIETQLNGGAEVQWQQLRNTLNLIPAVADMAACQTEAELRDLLGTVQSMRDSAENVDPASVAPKHRIYHLLWWLVSNISDHIAPCNRAEVEAHAHIAMPPQAAFFRVHSLSLMHSEAHWQLVQTKGSIKAWHGSKVANWYSILKHGLRSMSGTRMMLNGQAYGAGIYLSNNYATSAGYSGSYLSTARSSIGPALPTSAPAAAAAAAGGEGAAGAGPAAGAGDAAAANGPSAGNATGGAAAAAQSKVVERQLPDGCALNAVVGLCQVAIDKRLTNNSCGSSSGMLFQPAPSTANRGLNPGSSGAAAAVCPAAGGAAAPAAAATPGAGFLFGLPVGAGAPGPSNGAAASGSSGSGAAGQQQGVPIASQGSNIMVAKVPELVAITHLIVQFYD